MKSLGDMLLNTGPFSEIVLGNTAPARAMIESGTEVVASYLQAMKLSRKRKMPVILRMTTHVCHGKEKVSFAGWTPRPIGTVPAFDSSAGSSVPLTSRALQGNLKVLKG